MNRPYKVQHGNNMPIQAPLINEPNVPYKCPDLKNLIVYCRSTPEIIKKYLEPTPFEYVSDIFLAYVTDFTNCDITDGYTSGFYDTGIVVPVKYKDIYGANYMFEYEDYDYSVAGGRELWGYPKKFARCKLEKEGNRAVGSVMKNGIELIHVEVDLDEQPQTELPKMKWYPHLQVQVFPKAEGPGIFSSRLISRDTSADFKRKSIQYGKGTCILKGDLLNPLDEFGPVEVLGAYYEVGDYLASDEHGWGKVLETLVYDPEI